MRRSLLTLFVMFLAGLVGVAQTTFTNVPISGRLGVTTGSSGALATLQESDLTYLGAFDFPAGSSGVLGMTYRYVSGSRHFIYLELSGSVPAHEFVDPGFSLTSPPTAQYVAWGTAGSYGNTGWAGWAIHNNGAGPPQFRGIYFDIPTNVLCVGFTPGYGGVGAADYSQGCGLVNDTTHVMDTSDCYGLASVPAIAASTSMNAIPPWFTSAYLTAGYRVAWGAFGYRSSFGTSMGPAFYAMPFASVSSTSGSAGCGSSIPYISNTRLTNFSNNRPAGGATGPYTSPFPATTNFIGYKDRHWFWDPQGATGYITSGSGVDQAQACDFVSTTTHQAMMCAPQIAAGDFLDSVQASPTPNCTSHTGGTGVCTFGVTSIAGPFGNLAVGDVINVNFDTDPDNSHGNIAQRVTGISGTTVTTVIMYGTATNPHPRVGGPVTGGNQYVQALGIQQRTTIRLQSYDMYDLGKIVLGTLAQDDFHAAHEWDITNTMAGQTTLDGQGGGNILYQPAALIFDATAKQILVVVGSLGGSGKARVFGWQVPG